MVAGLLALTSAVCQLYRIYQYGLAARQRRFVDDNKIPTLAGSYKRPWSHIWLSVSMAHGVYCGFGHGAIIFV